MNKPHIKITYCTGCRWLLRSAWMAQELLTTFQEELGEVSLCPGSGGIFEIEIDGRQIWNFKEMRKFPELKELKQIVRNHIAPDKNLGHTDKNTAEAQAGESCDIP